MSQKPRILSDICRFLEEFAPARLAEEWDNVGLLIGDAAQGVRRIMTCLTLTPTTVEEATSRQADLVVTHHPLPFKAMRRITADTTPGRLVLQLIRAGTAVYSPHTSFDSASDGINENLARKLGLTSITPLVPAKNDPQGLGSGRCGVLSSPATLRELADLVKREFAASHVQLVGSLDRRITRVGVACGSAGSFLDAAKQAGCDLFVTGETSFHTCLEAEASDIALLLMGHYASERFQLEVLAEQLAKAFPQLETWASREERDPLTTY